MNLALIGYRGTGKSTIGRLLADSLGFSYVGFDAEIVARAGLSIPEIVERFSWDHFRDLEALVVEEFSAGDRQVLDTGGGVVTRRRNVEMLRDGSLVFLLEAEVSDILTRISSDSERPSLTGEMSFTDEINQVLIARTPLYRAAAHFIVNTSSVSAEQAADEITRIFREKA